MLIYIAIMVTAIFFIAAANLALTVLVSRKAIERMLDARSDAKVAAAGVPEKRRMLSGRWTKDFRTS